MTEQTERPPRPSIDIVPHDDTAWEVFIDTTTGLNLSVKVGLRDDGNPFAVVDPDTDDVLHSQHDGPYEYAYWTTEGRD